MTARHAALNVLDAVWNGNAYANLALKTALADFDARDAKWISALVYTTLDHILTIDYYLGFYIHSAKPTLRNVLRLGVCELLYMNTPPHAAIHESVSLCRQIGREAQTGFVNAVLRRIDRERGALPPLPQEPAERLSVQYSYPLWLVKEWISDYGQAFIEALLSAPPAPLELRAQYPCSADALAAELPVKSERGRLDPNCLRLETGLDPAALPSFVEGRMSVQSQSAMLCCRAMSDCRGKRVLDACAAPGGKSAYLSSLTENNIVLNCWELHAHRKQLLDDTLSRLHVHAHTEQRDASVYDAAYSDAFDFLLLDAPCSGLGQTHDKPDIRYAKSDGDIVALCAVQRSLLDVCSAYVHPGGVLLYATCTISKRENEEQIASFLNRHEEYTLESMPLPVKNDGTLQLFPNIHGTNGFFMARCRKCI